MIKILEFTNNRINVGLLISYVPILLLSTNVVMAASAYDPPPNQPSPIGTTTSTGSRGGCKVSNKTSLTVLAPIKRVGLTASNHPTFAWFVPDDSTFFLEFKLFEYDSNNKPQLIQETSLKSSSGIMKLSLPENKPGLALGKRYLWEVRMICNPNHPSTDLVARAEIEVVEKPQALKDALLAAKNPLEVAQLYARQGIWYEALSEALGASEDSRIKEFTSTLLEDLASLEEPEQRANLRQVVITKQQSNS